MKTKAPKLTPSPRKAKQSPAVVKDSNPSAVFISMALDMSWRLALVVLIPVVGGAYLDKHHKTGQIYLIIGFVLAVFGAGAVMYRSYKVANQISRGSK
jgi:F0F1-type ATP synthase assembly protein I